MHNSNATLNLRRREWKGRVWVNKQFGPSDYTWICYLIINILKNHANYTCDKHLRVKKGGNDIYCVNKPKSTY